MALKPSPNARSDRQLRMDLSYLAEWLPNKDSHFVMIGNYIVRFCVHNNVPLKKDKDVTALLANDDEEGATEVIILQQGDSFL
eukprot:4070584-Heterocapsa_arctica.AAC.1